MITHVNSVLVGKAIPASFTTADALAVGDVALFDENRELLKTAAEAAEAKSLYVGVAQKKLNVTLPNGTVAQKANIKFGNEIKKDLKPSFVFGKYVAPVQQVATITLTSATLVVGHRYVLRIVYKDLFEAPSFTKTYDVVATSTNATSLAAAFVSLINKDKGRRVQASNAAAVLTLTAMEKDDNEGINSITEYSVVNMEVSMYVTIPGALLSNSPLAIPGATIAVTAGTAGKGYWKQVRDEENRYRGYQGHVFTGAYPTVEPAKAVEEDASYDYFNIESDNKFLSNDNQYIKTTPVATEVYVKTAAGFNDSIVIAGIDAFLNGIEPEVGG